MLIVVDFIEDKCDTGYTIRTDLMEDGDSVQCIDDKDMHIQKINGEIVLVKKSFKNDCFIKS